jgi:MSHA biogenesis protein MshP
MNDAVNRALNAAINAIRRLGARRRCRPGRDPRARAGGFAFVSAIFLLVILGMLAAFVVSLSANAAASGAAAVQGVRALEAARAGLEWAAYQLRDPSGTLAGGATNLPTCIASPTTLALPGDLAAFNVQLTCTRYPDLGATPNFHEEGDKRVALYVVVATASQGTAGGIDYVERRLEARIEKCKDPAASGPAYSC